MNSDFLDNQTETFKSLLEIYNINLNEEQIHLLLIFLELVIKKDKEINLTAIKSYSDGLILHLLDSLLFTKLLSNVNKQTILDIGSGGGFPAIPLAITTNNMIHSLDSVNKKLLAQEEFVDQLDVNNFKTVHSRIEDYGKSHKFEYKYITARALAPLVTLVEYASPLLDIQGELIISKGSQFNNELVLAKNAIDICGFELKEQIKFDLPNDYGHRELVSLKKVRKSNIALPRQTGKAKKDPLF